MISETLRITKQKMQLIIEALTDQFKSLHIGRASSALVENIEVEQYGTRMPLKQIGSIAVPEANQLVITPWDKSVLGAIETAIRQSDLGFNPVNDGNAVRIMLPPLTEERRREMTKVVGRMSEEARIALRNGRREAWDKIQAAEKAHTITEDDRDHGRDELDKVIDDMNKAIEKIAAQKEHDIMSV